MDLDDLVEVPARRLVCSRPAGEQVSPLNSTGCPSSRKHVDPAVCPGVWMVRSRRSPTSITSSSGDREVVRRQHRRALGGDPHVDAGVAHRLDGLDVVPVPVGRQDAPDAGRPAHVEEKLVLTGVEAGSRRRCPCSGE